MEWISENLFFILVFLAMIAMHLFGHGHHGHGGGHHGHRTHPNDIDDCHVKGEEERDERQMHRT